MARTLRNPLAASVLLAGLGACAPPTELPSFDPSTSVKFTRRIGLRLGAAFDVEVFADGRVHFHGFDHAPRGFRTGSCDPRDASRMIAALVDGGFWELDDIYASDVSCLDYEEISIKQGPKQKTVGNYWLGGTPEVWEEELGIRLDAGQWSIQEQLDAWGKEILETAGIEVSPSHLSRKRFGADDGVWLHVRDAYP